MKSPSSFAKEDHTRKLERVLHIFASTLEDWTLGYNAGESPGDLEKDAEVSAQGAKDTPNIYSLITTGE
jgi:hypothetical protein